MRASNSHWSLWKIFFVTLGSKFDGVRLLPLHLMVNYEYFVLPIHFRN